MEKEKMLCLVRKAQTGDPEAMDALFSAYYNDVYYFALKTVKDPDVACDITQETFLEIIRTVGILKEPAAFVTWMKQITYHQCTRYFNKKTDLLEQEDADGNSIFDTLADEREGVMPAEVLEKEDFRRTILEMIDALTEQQRAAVLLYYFDELSVGQIAAIQGVSEGTVKSRLNYARKAIKASVESYEKKHNIKLHSFAFLPLFLLFFTEEIMPEAKAAQIHSTVKAAANSAAAANTAATGGSFLSRMPLAGKLVAGAAALLLTAGGVVLILGGIAAAVILPQLSQPEEPTTPDSFLQETAPRESLPVTQDSLLLLEKQSLEVQDVFAEYLRFKPRVIRTTDGRILTEQEGRLEEVPLDDQVIASKIFLADEMFACYADDGMLYVLHEERWVACPDAIGQPFRCHAWSRGANTHGFAVHSYEQGGLIHETLYDQNGLRSTAEYGLYDEQANAVIVHVEAVIPEFSYYVPAEKATRLGKAYIADGTVYISMSGAADEQEGLLCYPVKNTGIKAEDLLSDRLSMHPVFKGDDPSVIYFGTQISGETNYLQARKLPEGKTAEQIVHAVGTSQNTAVITFDDGSVYACLPHEAAQGSQELRCNEELTKRNQSGQIKDSFINWQGVIYFVMDDNLTYRIRNSGLPITVPSG